MPNVIHFYGERGLVDSLFLDLQSAGKIAAFMNEIEFPFREPTRLGLLDDAEVAVIIEAGFGGNRAGFGWPDAVVVATLPGGGKVVVFIEAKAGLYADEAADFTARQKGFNSKINGQLTLKFRLAQALRAYRRGGKRLVEPDDVARSYGEAARPRRLAKIDNLRNIVDEYLVGDEVECLFVALTDDDANVWPALDEVSGLLPFVPEPLSLDADAPDELWSVARNAWADRKKYFGWVGFAAVEEGLVPGDRLFGKARHFLDAKRAARRRSRVAGEATRIRPRAWADYPSDSPTIRLRDRIRSIMRDAIRGTDLVYDDKPKGSDSVIGTGERRLVKLLTPVPTKFPEAAVCMGVNVACSGFPESVTEARQTAMIAINKEEFEIIELRDPDMPDQELKDLIRDALAGAAVEDEAEG